MKLQISCKERHTIQVSEEEIIQKIADCELCRQFCNPLKKTAVKTRGKDAKVFVVGRNPGSTEINEDKAFGGASGKRLNEWLVGCGNPTDDPRKNIYFTSAIKCFCGNEKSTYKDMFKNCIEILKEQIVLHQPQLIISLGEDAFDAVKFTDMKFSSALFGLFRSSEFALFTKFEHHFEHMVWPHPSPLSRILNESENKKKMVSTYGTVNSFLRK